MKPMFIYSFIITIFFFIALAYIVSDLFGKKETGLLINKQQDSIHKLYAENKQLICDYAVIKDKKDRADSLLKANRTVYAKVQTEYKNKYDHLITLSKNKQDEMLHQWLDDHNSTIDSADITKIDSLILNNEECHKELDLCAKRDTICMVKDTFYNSMVMNLQHQNNNLQAVDEIHKDIIVQYDTFVNKQKRKIKWFKFKSIALGAVSAIELILLMVK